MGIIMADEALEKVTRELKWQLVISTILMTPAIYYATDLFLPKTWCMQTNSAVGDAATAAKLQKECLDILTGLGATDLSGIKGQFKKV